MNGCVLLLNDFCRINHIRPTFIRHRCGGSSFGFKHNLNNLIKLRTVRGRIISESKPLIPVNIYNGQDLTADSLVLISDECHCYVMLYLKRLSIIIICDGLNLYRDSAKNHPINDFLPISPANYTIINFI